MELAGKLLRRSPADTNIPLGILELEEYQQFEVEMDVSDYVLIYTDSLIKAADASRSMLGISGVLELLNGEVGQLPPDQLVAGFLTRIDQETGGGLSADDVTTLLLRANGTGARTSPVQSFLAPFRLVRATYQWARSGGAAGFSPSQLERGAV